MWTTDKPTEPGAYWVLSRPSPALTPTMVIVYENAGGRLLYNGAGSLPMPLDHVEPQVRWLRAEVPANPYNAPPDAG